MSSAKASNTIMRRLPSVDELLRSDVGVSIINNAGEKHAASMARIVISDLRRSISQEVATDQSKAELLNLASEMVEAAWKHERLAGTKRVINATGVVIHTNLGRASLSENARRAIVEAAGYCAIEYDLAAGKRGKRGGRAEALLAGLTGAEAVLIVNNCAAAAFFVLMAFASGGEVIISRGEMVEIGGDFRVPDVLMQSGATLHEVGTTNRTKLADYEKAINENTRVILRVHPSNYRIIGFTAMPGLGELSALALRHNVLLYEDIGSGALIDLSDLGLVDEPVVADSISAGVDIVTFSGDKLLGGPQSGIIAGKAKYIDRLRIHPLYRALRVDKIVCAGLESTLESYRRGTALTDVPVLRMLAMSKAEIEVRVERFTTELRKNLNSESDVSKLKFETEDGVSAIGGGAAAGVELETKLIAFSHAKMSVSRLEKKLRLARVPVITRIVDDRVMIDLRTVSPDEEADVMNAIVEAII